MGSQRKKQRLHYKALSGVETLDSTVWLCAMKL